MRRNNSKTANGTAANLGFEAKLWAAADVLRNNMGAAKYKHVVLGLIFLKYISDTFEAKHAKLDAQHSEGADPEDPDEYRAQSICWVPPEARWLHLKVQAKQPTIGQLVDDASRAEDVLGRIYEHFLSRFASAKGKKGGKFYTPRCVVKLLVEMLEPYRSWVYGLCCGSSGMFMQSGEFICEHARAGGDSRATIRQANDALILATLEQMFSGAN